MLNLVKIIDQRLLLIDDQWNSDNIKFIKNGYRIDVVKDFDELKIGNKIINNSKNHNFTNKERSYA